MELPSQIVLVGLMGSGKTTIGRRLAARLGRPMHDSDAEIEAATGRTVRVLRDELGVDAMHDLEARQLLDSLGSDLASVIAAAASVVDFPDCRSAMTAPGVLVVWLRGPAGLLAARFAAGAHRPAYGHDPAAFLAEQGIRRRPLYLALLPLIVDIDYKGSDLIVDEIMAALAQPKGEDRGGATEA